MTRRKMYNIFATIILLSSAFSHQFVDSASGIVSGRRVKILPSLSEMPIPIKGVGIPSGSLTCKPEGDSPELFSNVRWAGPNRMDNHLELQKRHTVQEATPDSNAWKLIFVNPTEDDSGYYYCLGTYQSSEYYNSTIKVIFVPPVKIDRCPERQFIVQDKPSFRIECHITGGSENSVNIFKDGKHLKRVTNDNDGFTIDHGTVKESDAGKYRIVIDSQGSGEYLEIDINVEVASYPEFEPDNTNSTGLKEFYGVEGDRAELLCKALGKPKPLITWLNPRKMNVSLLEGYSVNQVDGTLQIHRVNKHDDLGEFLCKAHNSIGTIEKLVPMKVYTKPNIVLFANQTVDENSEATFECRVTGEPKPDISIRRDPFDRQQPQPYAIGDGIVSDEDLSREEGGSVVYIYRIKIMATKANFGRHYCKATNKAGTTDERTGYLFVRQKPDLTLTPTVQYISPDKPGSLTCHIIAYPEPKITWEENNRQIINIQNHTVTKSDGRTHIVNLMLSGPQIAFNTYTCTAENQLGYNRTSIKLRIKSRPGFIRHELVEIGPTWIKLKLDVPEDNGDKVRFYKYRAIGRTLDQNNPTFTYHVHDINDTYIDASLDRNTIYTIKNLLPYYTYSFSIRAVNSIGESDELTFRQDTRRATQPDPPIIIKPSSVTHKDTNIISDYENGYLLRWSRPASDNGDPVDKYIIRFRKDDIKDIANERIVEQMSERPLEARLGPLEINQRYKIQVQAHNRYGASEPEYIFVQTITGRQVMSEFEGYSTTVYIALGAAAVVVSIMIDLIFCLSHKMGVIHLIYNRYSRYGLVEDSIK